MSAYDINEQFSGSDVPDYSGENWGFSVIPGSGFVESGRPIWWDSIGISNIPSSAGDPAYGPGGVFCVPQWSNPGVGLIP